MIQSLLESNASDMHGEGREMQFTFNSIVDPRQHVMGLLLDGHDDDYVNFLLVTRVPALTVAAQELRDVGGPRLNKTDKIVSYEKICYLLSFRHCGRGQNNGTIISFQTGGFGTCTSYRVGVEPHIP